jgi:hypothetical protein
MKGYEGICDIFKYSVLFFEVHILVTMKITLLRDMTLYNLVDIYQEKGVRRFLSDVKYLRRGKLSDDR